MKALVSRSIQAVKARVLGADAATSFSQEGEDRVLYRMFQSRLARPGFYVDVGAHHPTRFSNTYLFYRMGWRGLNLDAMPGSMDAFARVRPRDVNLEIAVAEKAGVLTYHSFNEPALNTFSAPLAEEYLKVPGVTRLATKEIACRPLAEVLRERVPAGTKIDFLTVDVEGLDLEVLRSNDWSRFRPEIVLVEALETPDLSAVAGSETARFLADLGYAAVSKTVNTVFFRDRKG